MPTTKSKLVLNAQTTQDALKAATQTEIQNAWFVASWPDVGKLTQASLDLIVKNLSDVQVATALKTSELTNTTKRMIADSLTVVQAQAWWSATPWTELKAFDEESLCRIVPKLRLDQASKALQTPMRASVRQTLFSYFFVKFTTEQTQACWMGISDYEMEQYGFSAWQLSVIVPKLTYNMVKKAMASTTLTAWTKEKIAGGMTNEQASAWWNSIWPDQANKLDVSVLKIVAPKLSNERVKSVLEGTMFTASTKESIVACFTKIQVSAWWTGASANEINELAESTLKAFVPKLIDADVAKALANTNLTSPTKATIIAALTDKQTTAWWKVASGDQINKLETSVLMAIVDKQTDADLIVALQNHPECNDSVTKTLLQSISGSEVYRFDRKTFKLWRSYANDAQLADAVREGSGLSKSATTTILTSLAENIYEDQLKRVLDLVTGAGTTLVSSEEDAVLGEQYLNLLIDNSSGLHKATGNAKNNIIAGDLRYTLDVGSHDGTWSHYYGGGDTMTGGKGNDTLIGGEGSDTYIFNKDDGQDVIRDYSGDTTSRSSNDDTLQFNGINQNNLWLTHTGNDLLIERIGSSDEVRIVDWFSDGTANQVENIKTADGKTLLNTDVNKLVELMSVFRIPTGTKTWTKVTDWNGQTSLVISSR